MAEPVTTNEQFLTSKWGPFPVWSLALATLVAAYVYYRFKAKKDAAAAAAEQPTPGAAAAVPTQPVAPQFIIEENEAPTTTNVTVGGIPGQPAGAPPVSQPIPSQPRPPIQGGNPPVASPPIAAPPILTQPGGGAQLHKPDIEYRVPAGSGESFSSIARKFGYKPGGVALYNYQIGPSSHSAEAKQQIKARGPNTLYGNELVYVPQQ